LIDKGKECSKLSWNQRRGGVIDPVSELTAWHKCGGLRERAKNFLSKDLEVK